MEEIRIDVDELAREIGCTAAGLRDRLVDLALVTVLNEAERLAHAEAFAAGQKRPNLAEFRRAATVKPKHLAQAANALLK